MSDSNDKPFLTEEENHILQLFNLAVQGVVASACKSGQGFSGYQTGALEREQQHLAHILATAHTAGTEASRSESHKAIGLALASIVREVNAMEGELGKQENIGPTARRVVAMQLGTLRAGATMAHTALSASAKRNDVTDVPALDALPQNTRAFR